MISGLRPRAAIAGPRQTPFQKFLLAGVLDLGALKRP